MLVQRRRRWPNIKTALVECVVFSWYEIIQGSHAVEYYKITLILIAEKRKYWWNKKRLHDSNCFNLGVFAYNSVVQMQNAVSAWADTAFCICTAEFMLIQSGPQAPALNIWWVITGAHGCDSIMLKITWIMYVNEAKKGNYSRSKNKISLTLTQ